LIYVGLITFKLTNTQEDYLLAGRRLGPWVVAFSERASGESAWLLIALPGAAIAGGFGESWAALGIILGIIASWYIIAQKLREETEKYDVLTIPEYLHRKFKDESNIIRILASIIITFFFAFYVSAQFHASGKILHSIFGINEFIGITLGALIIILYTIMGGFFAVAYTDLIQGIIMFCTLVLLPIVGFIELNELDISLITAVQEAGNNRASFLMGKTGWAAISVIIGGLSWGLGYMGQPHLLMRYMAIRDPRDIKISRRIAVAWAIPGISGAFLIGLVALGLYGPDFFQDVEKAMPFLAIKLLPAWMAGILISGAVAAMMSTADSQLLVSSSTITEDFYHRFMNHRLSDKKMVKLSRITTILIGIMALTLAIISQWTGKTIFNVVSYAWSGLGSSFGPALILSLWWKKTSRKGIIAGLITGSLVTVIWANSSLQELMTERLASFILAFLAVIIFSLREKNGQTADS